MTALDKILAIAARQLPAAGIDCILIGGFAVNHYGYTRNTLDVDFMILADKLDALKQMMKDAGFTNLSIQDNVAFFAAPDATARFDFLRTDAGTMNKLMKRAINVSIRGHSLKVPALPDLIAMKIFSLSQDIERRMGKDLPDIAYLSVIHNLDLDADIRPLCNQFGTPETYALIRKQVEALRAS